MPVSEQDRRNAWMFLGYPWQWEPTPTTAPSVIAEAERVAEAFAAQRQRGAEERQAVIVAWLNSGEAHRVIDKQMVSNDDYPSDIAQALADALAANAHMEKRDG